MKPKRRGKDSLNEKYVYFSLAEDGSEDENERQVAAEKSTDTVQHTNRFLFALNVGFFAGIVWGIIKILSYYIGFTKVIPAFLAEPFFKDPLLQGWTGHLLGLGHFVLFSMLAALIYALLLYKINGPWLGYAYGILWWSIIYLGVGPMLQMMKRIDHLDWNTIINDFCIFLLWGVFIGYTIAFEYNDQRITEPFSNFDENRG